MNKASGGNRISVELLQILKDDAVTVLHSICQPIWKPQQWPQDWKRSVFIPIPKKGNAKEWLNYHTIALISHTSKERKESEVIQSCPTLCNPMDCSLPGSSFDGIFQARILEWLAISASKVMLKILQARLQQYENRELPDVQTGFRKGRGTRDQIGSIRWSNWSSLGSSKEQESSRKTFISALLTMPKPFTVWITTNCGKFFKRWENQNTWPASWEICMQVKKQQLELGMEQQNGSK